MKGVGDMTDVRSCPSCNSTLGGREHDALAETGVRPQASDAVVRQDGADAEPGAPDDAFASGPDSPNEIAPNGVTPPPSLHVLVVEDNPANQRVLELILTHLGHTVLVANDGVDAIGAVARGQFDIILMDLHMPRLDGFSASLAIRAMPGGDMPILAVTADGSPGVERRVKDAGMDDYIAKPVDVADLAIRLLTHAAAHTLSSRSA